MANAIIKKMEEDRCIDKKVARNGKKINKQVVIQKLRELKNKLSLARGTIYNSYQVNVIFVSYIKFFNNEGKLDSRKAK